MVRRRRRVGPGRRPGSRHDGGCSATPTIVDGKCFITTSNARLYCLSAKDGTPLSFLACLVFKAGAGGLITRIEENLDPVDMAALTQAG